MTVRLSLPWIRSMPLSSVRDVRILVDGAELSDLVVEVDGRLVPLSGLRDEQSWWYVQDRLVVHSSDLPDASAGGAPGADDGHRVDVSFDLVVPYLSATGDAPLALPMRDTRVVQRPASQVSREMRSAAWTFTASAFNWTPEVLRSDRSAQDLAVGIVVDGIASSIEVEAGQVWRGFPEPTEREVDALRSALESVGGAVAVVGGSIDDWTASGERRPDKERLAFLTPQLRAAARLGARGVRVPFGQPGAALLRSVSPLLEELDLVLYQEIQGQQGLQRTADAAAVEELAALDSPHHRLLIDLSMCMPALPVSWLDLMAREGLDEQLLARLRDDWADPATGALVLDHLRSGRVPSRVHTLYMNLLVRFGRTSVAELAPLLPLTGGFHLKFWDLEDVDGRVSAPLRDLGALLRGNDFRGSLTSEWGGHEWLDDDPAEMTRAHLAIARSAIQP